MEWTKKNHFFHGFATIIYYQIRFFLVLIFDFDFDCKFTFDLLQSETIVEGYKDNDVYKQFEKTTITVADCLNFTRSCEDNDALVGLCMLMLDLLDENHGCQKGHLRDRSWRHHHLWRF